MNEATVQHMLDVLRNESTFAKMQAAVSLGMARVHTPEVIQALAGLLDNEYPPARVSALYALGRSGKADAAATVRRALSDSDPTVRTEACRSLAALQDIESAGALPIADEDPRVRLAALDMAAALGQEGPAEAIAARFEVESDPALRMAVLRCLRALAPSGRKDLPDRGLNDPDPGVRMEALLSLAIAHKPLRTAAIPRVKALLKDQTAIVRRAAVRALLRLASAEEALALPLTQDKDPTVRHETLLTLGDMGTRAAWDAFSAAQADPVREVRRAASTAYLRQLARDDTLRSDIETAAVKCTHDDNALRQREGVWMLGEMRSASGFPHILSLARRDFPDPSSGPLSAEVIADAARSALVMWTVVRTADARGATLGMEYAEAPIQSLRIHGTRALGVLKHAPAEALLVRLVLDTKVEAGERFFTYGGRERTNAIWAIGEIGGKQGLAALATLATMEKPVEAEPNIQLIGDILARHKYDDPAKINGMRKSAYKHKGEARSVTLADVIEKLTGQRPDVPPVPQATFDSEFFLYEPESR